MGDKVCTELFLGVELKRSEIIENIMIPKCNHEYDKNFKHCPECGLGKKEDFNVNEKYLPIIEEEVYGIDSGQFGIYSLDDFFSKAKRYVLGAYLIKIDSYNTKPTSFSYVKLNCILEEIKEELKKYPEFERRPIELYMNQYWN